MVTAFVGLGANLGDAPATLDAAVAALAALPATHLAARSPRYRSAPVDASGPDFLNEVVQLETSLAPLPLLDAMQAIERLHGRERPYRNAPRTLDLDLLLYGDVVLDSPRLTLPHPRMHLRAFVLRPLADVSPGRRLPGRGSVESLLAAVQSQAIERIDPP